MKRTTAYATSARQTHAHHGRVHVASQCAYPVHPDVEFVRWLLPLRIFLCCLYVLCQSKRLSLAHCPHACPDVRRVRCALKPRLRTRHAHCTRVSCPLALCVLSPRCLCLPVRGRVFPRACAAWLLPDLQQGQNPEVERGRCAGFCAGELQQGICEPLQLSRCYILHARCTAVSVLMSGGPLKTRELGRCAT